MSNPCVYDGDGGYVGSWDKTNGTLQVDGRADLHVDSEGFVYDESGNSIGQIDSKGRLS